MEKINEGYLKKAHEYYRLLLEKKAMVEEFGELRGYKHKFNRRFRRDEGEQLLLEKTLSELENSITHLDSELSKLEGKHSEDIIVVKVVNEFKLSKKERDIMLLMLFDEATDYDNLRQGDDILWCISANEFEVEQNRVFLYKNSPLRKNEVLYMPDKGDTLLDSSFVMSEEYIRKLMGHNDFLDDEEIEDFKL
jgi:hypothetical protein